MKRTAKIYRGRSRGFTLLEFIIYIGLVGFILSAAVLFAVEFVGVRAKAVALAEAARNTKFAVERMAHEVRSAVGINYADSVFAANPGTLSIITDDPGTDPIIFLVDGGQLMMSQGGGANVPLTPAAAEVVDFTVDNVADSANSRSVRVRLVLGTESIGSLEEFADQTAYETTIRSWKNDGFSGDNIPPSPLPSYVQSAYRLFANANSTNVGAALAAQDTSATLSSNGDIFRLRLMLDVNTAELPISGQSFKLQYAVKVGSCDTGFSGEIYTDVTGATPIAYYDNAAPADGVALTTNANDPVRSGRTTVSETYEEANNLTNTNPIAMGFTGLWDFALADNDGATTGSYCLRLVKSNGAMLNSYLVVPEISTVTGALVPTLAQSAYRLFANANSTDVGAALAAQDTAATLSADGAAFRLRALVHVGTAQLAVSGATLKLQYAAKSGTCDTGFSGESYADVTVVTPIAYYNNATPADGAALTPNANDPTHSGHTKVSQTYEEANNFTNTASVPSGQDAQWDFALTDNNGGAASSYCLRVVKSDGSLLDSYSVVPEVATVAGKTFRVTEYYLAAGQFTGTTYDLTLNQNLMANYFAIVQGSDGDGTSGGDLGPAYNYASLISDPWGTGDLNVSAGANVLRLQRGSASNQWQGVVTVVECLGDCSASGFRLLDVQNVAHNTTSTSGTDTSAVAWGNLNKVLLMGGFNGAGCYTAATNANSTHNCHVRLWPTGTATINWTRNNGGGALTTSTSTVMVVEWGSEWTVQRVLVSGTNGGNAINAVAEYNTAAITAVLRDHTWVWGTGNTADNGIGDSAEGAVPTLGNGVAQNATETTVALGLEYNDQKDFDVYVMTHPDLAVDYRFKTDSGNGLLVTDVTVDSATLGERMALSYNGGNGTNNNHPSTTFSARYLSDTFIRLERRRSGIDFPAWVQGINFAAITQ